MTCLTVVTASLVLVQLAAAPFSRRIVPFDLQPLPALQCGPHAGAWGACQAPNVSAPTSMRTDTRPSIKAIARLDVSVIVEARLYGGSSVLAVVGTMISGLRPNPLASVAAEGIVASLNAGPVRVARPGIGATVVLPKASAAF